MTKNELLDMINNMSEDTFTHSTIDKTVVDALIDIQNKLFEIRDLIDESDYYYLVDAVIRSREALEAHSCSIDLDLD